MLHALGEGDARALHRTRVASRRLREILPVLQLKPELAERLGRRLKKVTAQLGAVRELDVLAGLAAELKAAGQGDPSVLRAVASAIEAERAKARETFYAKLPTHELERIARKIEKVGVDLRERKPSPDVRMLKRQQDTLGRLHDLQVLIDRVREMQPSIASPDFSMWRKIDGLAAALEDDCRRLHAKFLRQQSGVRAICQRAGRLEDAAQPPRRAVAS